MYYTEAGHLSGEGKKASEKFQSIVRDFLNIAKTEAEVKLLGSILSNLVGNIVADEGLKRKSLDK